MDRAQKKANKTKKQCKVIPIDAYRKQKEGPLSKAKSLELFLKFDEDCAVFE